jgi:hypothetical protein
MAADAPLNGATLDPVLDRTRPAPAATDAVEAALAKALERATAAGRWDVVSQLARELEARRLARMDNVVALDPKARLSST